MPQVPRIWAPGGATGVAVPIYEYNAAGGYDTNGNVLGYTDTVMGAWSFGYDQLNRLVDLALRMRRP